MADEKATGGGQEAQWRATLEADSGSLIGVQVEAVGAEAAAAVERSRVERMMREEKAEMNRGAELARAKVGETIAGITLGSIPSPRRASPAASSTEGGAPPLPYKDKSECEAAARDRARLEKIAKEMADIASTRQQERRTSASPKDLQNLA